MKEEKDMNEIPEEVRILQGLDEETQSAAQSDDEEEKARKRKAKIEAEIARLAASARDGRIRENELNDKLDKFGLSIDKYGLTVQESADIFKALEEMGVVIEPSSAHGSMP